MLEILSPRERQVAELVCHGLANKQIANELGVKEGTIKAHIHSILKKIGGNRRYAILAQGRRDPMTFAALYRERENWACGHANVGVVCAECYRVLSRRANELAEEVVDLQRQLAVIRTAARATAPLWVGKRAEEE